MGQWFRRERQRPAQWIVALAGGLAVIGLGLWATAAEAARLQFWRFDVSRNRLEFTTDNQVQPRVQLIPNPVRLVVDLPGVKLDRPTVNQSYNAAVRSIRVGQFDAQTARIVVELSPGYTVDPQQVKVQGDSPASWSIDLPTPQVWQPDSALPSAQAAPPTPLTTLPAPLTVSPAPLANPAPLLPAPAPPIATVSPAGSSTLEDILILPDGLLLKTRQSLSGTQIKHSGREITVDLSGVTALLALTRNDYKINNNYHGLQRISVRQVSTQPPVTRVTLKVDRRSPDWQVSPNAAGGALLLPQGGSAAIPNGQRPSQTISLLQGRMAATPTRPSTKPFSNALSRASNLQLATIQSVALGGSQLLIQADRPIYYTTGWEGARYRITLRGAQWGSGVREPQTAIGSALTDIILRQEGQNAILLATPAPGVRIGVIARADAQTVVLNLNRGGTPTAAPIFQPSLPGPSVYQSPTLPRPSGRRVVVIDPGHGGPDVGAVGIGGLRETNVVLPISLEVVRLLQQQGLQVYVTRTDESREVDLPPRVALAERVRADAFVSIHANAINLSRPDINGTEVYYAPGSASGAELSRYILNSIVRNVNMPNRGVRAARFYVIRKTSMPATLVETGFVTGAQDAPKLGDPTFQRQMAAAIAQGIIEFLNSR